MRIDIPTVTIMIVIGAALMSGGLFAVTRGRLGEIRGLRRWAAATLIQSLGWSLIGPLRGLVPEIVAITLGYGLLTYSLGVYLIVLAHFTATPLRPSRVYGLVVVQSLILAYFVIVPNVPIRMLAVTLCAATLMLLSSHSLLSGPERHLPSHVFTALLFAACGAMFMARCVYILVWEGDPNLAPTRFIAGLNDVTYLIFYVTATLLSFGFVLMVSDRYISQQEQAKDTLRQSEARFRTLFVEAPLGSALIDSLTRRIYEVNPRFAEIAGRTVEEMRNVDWKEITHPDDVQPDLDNMALLNAGVTNGFRMEKRYVRPGGAVVWIDMVIARLTVEDPAHPRHLCMIQDITERRRVDSALRDSLREKEALLKETHHRVKNNLALISSLMRLEAGRSAEAQTKATLNEMQARIRSVALLNETLYRTGSYATVKLADYLKQIATHVFRSQNADAEAVRLVLDLEPVEVETAQAIPCGLIINELLTNSLKHAFNAGGQGEVRVSLRAAAGGEARLSVSDTGAGLPGDFASRGEDSLGLQLVSDLAKQLMGDLEVGPGATFTVTFVPRRRADTTEIPSPPQKGG